MSIHAAQGPSQAPPPNLTFSRRSSDTSASSGSVEGMGGSSGMGNRLVQSPATVETSAAPTESRLKHAVAKLRLVKKATTSHSFKWVPTVTTGEPGVDVRKVDIDEKLADQADVEVRCSDYNSEHFQTTTKTAKDFQEWLETDRPSWSKVRWLHVNGISWSVMKPLALKYDLHPLAIEDCLNLNRHSRSKSDYYPKHLFLNLLFQSLSEKDAERLFNGDYGTSARSREEDDDSDVESQAQKIKDAEKHPPALNAGQTAIQQLTSGVRLELEVENLSIFLGKDGTLLTIFNQVVKRDYFKPIFERLAVSNTTMRESEDASMLLQAVLDLTVDNLLVVTDTYRHQLLHLEAQTLADPEERESLRHLHILSGEFLLLKRALTPLANVVYHLKRHDTERSMAALQASGTPQRPPLSARNSFDPNSIGLGPPSGGLGGNVGFLSAQAKVYMSDVHDHLDEVISSLELFSALAQNLIDYSFNVANLTMNESMKGLSLVTVVFLPVSVLTGYFGMNFTGPFPGLNDSVSYFWKIAIPTVVGLVFLFTYSNMVARFKSFKRKYILMRANKKPVSTKKRQ